jgi:hypothetical protein
MSAFPLMLARVILENMIHLLECATHSLRHEEEGPNAREHTEYSKEHVGTVARVLNQRWGDETNNKVVEPVRTSRNGDALGSEGRGEDF